MNSFDKLLTEISWLYDKGYPDFSIKEDREALYDYLLSIGFPHSDVIELSERFIREEIDDETIIKYRDEDGESKEMKAGSAKRQDKDHPAKIEYDKLKGKDDDKKEKPKGTDVVGLSRDGESEPKAEPKVEPKVEPKDEPKDAIDAKIKKQQEEFKERGLDEFAKPTKKPENPNLDKSFTTGGQHKVHDGLDKVDKAVQESEAIPDEDKKNITSTIQKIKDGKAETISQDEIDSMRRWVAIKDQEGRPEGADLRAEFYLADVIPNDWRKGQAPKSKKQARKSIPLVNKVQEGLYNEIKKLADSIGLKSQPPENSRTSAKGMAPTEINKKRKPEKIDVGRKDGKVVSATIAGQTHTKKSVPRISDVEKALIGKGVDSNDARRQARKVVLGIQRYNDQIDLLAETAEANPKGLEVVDYGDTSTTEGKKKAINQCLQDLGNTLERKLEKSIPPHPPLTREHYELTELIRNIKNPLDDPEWDNLSFEERQERANKFNKEMGQILVEMNALGDMQTSRAEVAEAITYMHRLSQGFTAIMPSSETFKVTDVYAIKDPGDTKDPKKIAESIQQVLVSIEVSGGESVKFEGGARSASAGKVSMTVYKNKGTRKSINDLLDTYSKIYRGDDYPPSDEVIKELDDVRDKTKAQVINDGIMSEEEYDKIYEDGMKTGEKAFDAMAKKNRIKLEEAGFTEDDLRRVRDSFMKHCAHGKVMAEINNRDTEYNKFNNVAHKISRFKQDKETKEVINKGEYKTVEADGIDVISGMNFSCDQGFTVATPPKKKISPENTNPSAIIALDSQTGKKVN